MHVPRRRATHPLWCQLCVTCCFDASTASLPHRDTMQAATTIDQGYSSPCDLAPPDSRRTDGRQDIGLERGPSESSRMPAPSTHCCGTWSGVPSSSRGRLLAGAPGLACFVIGARLPSGRRSSACWHARWRRTGIAARRSFPAPCEAASSEPGLERRLAGSSVIRRPACCGTQLLPNLGEFSTRSSSGTICLRRLSSSVSRRAHRPRPGTTTRRMRVRMAEMPLSRATLFSPRVFDDILIEVPRSQAVCRATSRSQSTCTPGWMAMT